MIKKILLWFFAVLGGIFFCILVALAYLIIADPFNLRPIITMFMATTPVIQVSESVNSRIDTAVPSESPNGTTPESTGADGSNAQVQTVPVTDAQADALKSVGLEASAISQAQEACFVRILGQARVDEVKAGAVPTAAEFFSARECLN